MTAPVESNYLMHLFDCPDEAQISTVCRDRIPKKKREKLRYQNGRDYRGWGIHFKERRRTKFLAVVASGAGSAVALVFFALWWGLSQGHDIQGASGIGQFIVALVALWLVVWTVWALE
jgi:hypothetical protein